MLSLNIKVRTAGVARGRLARLDRAEKVGYTDTNTT
jgi:hypothetical protein